MKTLIIITAALLNGYSNTSLRHCERFTVGVLHKISEEDYCQDITTSQDKFTSKITYSSPLKYYINYHKIISDSTKTYLMRLSTSGATLNLLKKGCYHIVR